MGLLQQWSWSRGAAAPFLCVDDLLFFHLIANIKGFLAFS